MISISINNGLRITPSRTEKYVGLTIQVIHETRYRFDGICLLNCSTAPIHFHFFWYLNDLFLKDDSVEKPHSNVVKIEAGQYFVHFGVFTRPLFTQLCDLEKFYEIE